jgi:hypothetical protein
MKRRFGRKPVMQWDVGKLKRRLAIGRYAKDVLSGVIVVLNVRRRIGKLADTRRHVEQV